jgi:hypothetical protein
MRLRTKTVLAGLCLAAALPFAAQAEEPAPEPIYVCTAEQVLGPFLGGLLPVTFSPEVAALFGVDPAECQTEVPPFAS